MKRRLEDTTNTVHDESADIPGLKELMEIYLDNKSLAAFRSFRDTVSRLGHLVERLETATRRFEDMTNTAHDDIAKIPGLIANIKAYVTQLLANEMTPEDVVAIHTDLDELGGIVPAPPVDGGGAPVTPVVSATNPTGADPNTAPPIA